MLDKIPSAPPKEDEMKTPIGNKTPVENSDNIVYVNLDNSKRSAPKKRRVKHLGTAKAVLYRPDVLSTFDESSGTLEYDMIQDASFPNSLMKSAKKTQIPLLPAEDRMRVRHMTHHCYLPLHIDETDYGVIETDFNKRMSKYVELSDFTGFSIAEVGVKARRCLKHFLEALGKNKDDDRILQMRMTFSTDGKNTLENKQLPYPALAKRLDEMKKCRRTKITLREAFRRHENAVTMKMERGVAKRHADIELAKIKRDDFFELPPQRSASSQSTSSLVESAVKSVRGNQRRFRSVDSARSNLSPEKAPPTLALPPQTPSPQATSTQNARSRSPAKLNAGHTVLRNALPQNSQNKWDRMKSADGYFQIPYIITGDYDSRERDIISGAMKTIGENTCIRFVPRNGETDFIDIQNQKDEGCYTNVGRDGGQNVVMLEANSVSTCVEPDIVIHELLHTIGLWHEHMRADRDDYIKVLYKNIEPAYFAQFTKVTSDEAVTYGIPYDYTSVMHYGETAFARSGEISMRTNDQRFQKVIGHQKSASQSDYKKVCMIYNCPVCKGANSPNQPIAPPVVSGNGGQVQATYGPYITSGSSSCRGNRLPEFMCNVMISNGIASCESQVA
ncbi:hypothetical protein WR25_10524 isoform B [Diploscapter pachys]|uniref:Metalloendopeptidase n=1 Tax=Diploscapter pachys TaxID=2018661 RepID=A0A2A2JZ35_9BILA|nr:hypothetical protein WR25_10524 isoform B [Diploscapter pachys]